MFSRDNSVIVSWFCAIAFGLGLLLANFSEAATIYIWRDDNGVRQYTDYCPPGEKCRTKTYGSTDGSGDGKGKKGKSWQNADTAGTDTTDSGSSTSSGGTTDTSGTSSDTGSGSTTAGTDTTTTEPTAGSDTTTNGDTTASGDTASGGDTTGAGDTSTSGDTTTAGDTTNSGDTTGTTTTTNTGSTANGFAILDWDSVNDPSVSGYHVFYAIAGTAYQAIDVGNTTTYTLNGLNDGTRYYFRVAAYDAFGNQGGFSNEVYKDMP